MSESCDLGLRAWQTPNLASYVEQHTPSGLSRYISPLTSREVGDDVDPGCSAFPFRLFQNGIVSLHSCYVSRLGMEDVSTNYWAIGVTSVSGRYNRSRGVPCTGDTVYRAEGRAKKARYLPVGTRRAVELMGRELDGLLEVKSEAEEAMIKESHRHRISRILETAPGMGRVRVAQVIPIVITPYRFRTKRQFWAYCGFGVVVRSSSDWMREDGRWIKAKVNQTRGLNFNHNRMLKAIFKGAAITVIAQRHSNPLRGDYDRLLDNGTKPNLAKLTVARKVAAIVLAMWKKEEVYSPEKYRITEAA